MPRELDLAATESLVARLRKIDENQKPLWGTMTPSLMMAHCITAVKMAFGEIPAKVRVSPWQASLARLFFVDLFPFPKNSPTAPELDPNKKLKVSGEFQAIRDELIRAIYRVNATSADYEFSKHPLFRKMSRKQWGKLMYKHMDHHLRQFGV
jgi:hypothetical protein